jgi:glycosyltransferase involved in cell wall biosynthesis
MTPPVISVIIPTFNRSKLLQETLDSLQKQTFKDWEALIVDDGSEDNTEEKVLQMGKADPRIRYVKRSVQPSGPSVCRNEGTDASEGKYIIYLDSDDCLAPWALENRVREMELRPELDFGVFPCVVFRNQPGDMRFLWNLIDTDLNDIDRFLSIDIPWQTASPIWRRAAILKLGSWNSNLLQWDDWEYHLRAIIMSLKYEKFYQPDFFWRTNKISTKDSLSDKPIPAEKLGIYEQLFFQIQQLLSEAELLTDKRLKLFVGLYYWLAKKWEEVGSTQNALRIWTLCYEKGLVDYNFYLQGKWYLKYIAKVPRVRRWVGDYLSANWPPEFTTGSKTLHKTLLSEEFYSMITAEL